MKDLLSALADIAYNIHGIWRNRYFGLLVAIVLGIVGAIAIIIIPGKYEATSRVNLETQSIIGPLMVGMTVKPDAEQQVEMVARTLLSRPNLEKVARAIGEVNDGMSQGEIDGRVKALGKAIDFRPEGARNLYLISYQNKDQARALGVVNAILEMFVDTTLGDKRRDTREAIGFLNEQITQYEKRLRKSEEALKDFKVRNIEFMPNLAVDYLKQAAEAQRDLETAELLLQEARNQRAALRGQLETIPAMVPSGERAIIVQAGGGETEIEKRLAAARKQLDEVRLLYTEIHPEVRNARERLTELEAQRKREIDDIASGRNRSGLPTAMAPNKVYQDIKIALANTEAKVAGLQVRLAEARLRLTRSRELARVIPTVEAEFTDLTRDQDVSKKNYEELLRRRDAAELASNIDASATGSEFRIVDPPRVSAGPVSPPKPLMALALLAGSIVVGMLAAYLLEQRSPRVYTVKALRRITSTPVLGSVPMSNGELNGLDGARRAYGFMALLALHVVLMLALWLFLRLGGGLPRPDAPQPATLSAAPAAAESVTRN
ncbi:MAG: GNVR domain-containing protein [Burkholderiaceae bacterium]